MTELRLEMVNRLVRDMENTSTDVDTKVGCVITDRNMNILSTGSNHHTQGVEQTEANISRPDKYDWIEHAERNAIYSAAKRGVALDDAQMHLPGFPCVECARAIVQSGITMLFHGTTEGWDNARYSFDKSRTILEAGNVALIVRDEPQ